mmetsp:Transcript_5784/g.10360  ORF Transcript_5784/g.10360 Transcript_5784/m.10360 type:complete len:284 (+) Transcript_5784:282-1133(+)
MQGKVHTDLPLPSSRAPPIWPKTSNCGSADVMKAIRVKVRRMKKRRKHMTKASVLFTISRIHASAPLAGCPSAKAFCKTSLSKSRAKSLVRNLCPIFKKPGRALSKFAESRPPLTMRRSLERASAASSKSTNHELSPSLTNSKCPCAGCSAHGVPEQSASMTVLPNVSKLEADKKRSLAAYAVRSSVPFNIFLKGRTFGRPEAGPASRTVWQYPEVPSPTITKAQSSGRASQSRWIRFSADHRPADRKIARGSAQPWAFSFASQSERKASALSCHSTGSALNS